MTSRPSELDTNRTVLVYDGDCPVCSNYVVFMEARKRIGAIELVNAREVPGLYSRLLALGYDLDEGMLLNVRGNIHYGHEVMRELTDQATTGSGYRFIYNLFFGSTGRSKGLYTVLKRGRASLLRLLGRRRFRDSSENPRGQ